MTDDLKPDRKPVYERLASIVGNTPLIELNGPVINGCRFFAKLEYQNPTGSHYDREMLSFICGLESARKIRVGDKLVETTTGNLGASLAWLCRALGYQPPTIVIPADMPRARREQIQSFGGEIELSPAGRYITGIREALGGILRSVGEAARSQPGGKVHLGKHWANTSYVVDAMKECGEEIIRDASSLGVRLDYFLVALGNGSTALGLSEALWPVGISLIGVEPSESPNVAETLAEEGRDTPMANRMRQSFSVRVPLDQRKHRVIGTGGFSSDDIFENMRRLMSSDRLYDIVHPTDAEIRDAQLLLMDVHGQHVGISSAACMAAALKFVESEEIHNKNISLLFYDQSWKYLDW